MFSRPGLGLAEIAWRWSFGFAVLLSLVFLLVEYFRTLPVTSGDLFLLRTRHPILVSEAVAHIFQGSAIRLGRAGLVLFLLLSVVWIVLASLARTSAVDALLNYFREDGLVVAHASAIDPGREFQHGSPMGVNLLRVVSTIAALLACLGTIFLAKAVSPPTNPSPGQAMLVFLALTMAVFLAWWLLNWILSVAAIFVVTDGSSTFSAISKAMNLWHIRWGSIMAAGTWFGIAHALVFFIASSVIAFPLAFTGVVPFGIVLGGVSLIVLVYFAAADFLYAGKMAAYVAIAQLPDEPEFESPTAIDLSPTRFQTSVDRSEVILSDVRPSGKQ